MNDTELSETMDGRACRGREGKGGDTANKLSIVLLPYNALPLGGITPAALRTFDLDR